MTPILAFDIETVPDVAASAASLPTCPRDSTTPRCASGSRKSGAAHPATTSRRITCSRSWPSPARCATAATFAIWSIGEVDDPEPELIRRFFDGIEKLTPQLVSWNGGGFDLPVLNTAR